jgi:hypothetical protein
MGHDPGGFRLWWRQLSGSDATLDNAHLMRLAGRFGRRVHGYAKAHKIPVVNCSAEERKHDLAEDYLGKTTITHGLFLVLVGRTQAPVWDVSANHHIERKRPMPYVNNYSFHILDAEWRGQQIVHRIGQTRRYQASQAGLKAITALIVLRDKTINRFSLPPRDKDHPEPDTARRPLCRHPNSHARSVPCTRHRRLNIENFFSKHSA